VLSFGGFPQFIVVMVTQLWECSSDG